MNGLSHLRPFSQGLADEVSEGMVRIYDCNGFPRIEAFVDTNEETTQDLESLAQAIVSALNTGPDRSGP